MKNRKNRIVYAALAGLMTVAMTSACSKPASQEKSSGSAPEGGTQMESAGIEKHACKGMNSCQGQGGCGVEGQNECKGKNPCKGKGGCKTT